jgi:hypothetical protein
MLLIIPSGSKMYKFTSQVARYQYDIISILITFFGYCYIFDFLKGSPEVRCGHCGLKKTHDNYFLKSVLFYYYYYYYFI